MRLITKVLLVFALCLFSSTCSFAQEANLSKIVAALPQYEHVEGTVSVTGYQSSIGLGGGTAVAKIWFSQPDFLRIEVQANPAQGTRALVVVAQGDQTKVYDPTSRRLRVFPYNALTEWWRGWDVLHGGPANAVFAGFSSKTLPQFFDVASANETKQLHLLAASDKSRMQPDFVRVGGSGDEVFYAPFAADVWDYPSQINWHFAANGLPAVREEGFAEKVLYRTTLEFDATTKLPKTAVVKDYKGRLVASFAYDLKTVTNAFDKSTFTIAQASEQIPEAAKLRAPSKYSGQDAATLFNKGVALAIGEEDYTGAYAAWQIASKANPKAVAPWFALYQSALLTHDLRRAQSALDALAQILGDENVDVLTRRATLATSFLHWDDAENALEKLVELQPKNTQYLLALANLMRSQGKTASERGLLKQIIALPDAPSGILAAAALNWSQNALTRTDRTAGELEENTPAQKLCKIFAAFNTATPPTTIDTSAFEGDASLLTALALIQEEQGRVKQAIQSWSKVAEIFPYPLDDTAHWHLLSLAAKNDDAETAMLQYQALLETALTLDAKNKLHQQTINLWQKAFAQDDLKELLKRRAFAMKSTADDAQLWHSFKSTFGSDQEVLESIKNGAIRFPDDAWWPSLRADWLSARASSPEIGKPGARSVSELLHEALEEVDKAISKAPEQPYYAIQKALILRRLAMPKSWIIDPGKRQNKIDALDAAIREIRTKWPHNDNVMLATDIVRLPLDMASEREATMQSLRSVLHNAVPLQASYFEGAAHAQGGNHMRAFIARQAKAAIARRQGNADAVAQYYRELMVSSRSADEEQGIAINYLRQLIYAKDTSAIAGLLTRLSHEPWEWKEITTMMNAAGSILSLDGEMAGDVIETLHASPDPYSHWAAARLSATMVARLTLALNNPKAPEKLQGLMDASLRSLAAALTSLVSEVDGNDKILASRAAAALGESALERGLQSNDDKATKATKVAVQWYQKAIALNPDEFAFRKNLILAHHAAGDAQAAAAARSRLLANIPLDPAKMRQAASLTLLTADGAADKSLATKLGVSAFLLAQSSTTTSIPIFWHTGITAARCLMAEGKIDQAEAIYRRLSLPQWTITDRAVTYLDWQHQLELAGEKQQAAQVRESLQALGLNNPQMGTAEWNWQMLD